MVLRALAGVALYVWSIGSATLRNTAPWWPIYLTHWILVLLAIYLVMVARLELRAGSHAYVQLEPREDGGMFVLDDAGPSLPPLETPKYVAAVPLSPPEASESKKNLQVIIQTAAEVCRSSSFGDTATLPPGGDPRSAEFWRDEEPAAAAADTPPTPVKQNTSPPAGGGEWLELDKVGSSKEQQQAAGDSGSVGVSDLSEERQMASLYEGGGYWDTVEEALWSASLTGSFMVVILYWVLVYPHGPPPRPVTVAEHTVPLLLMLLDLRTGRPQHPYRTTVIWSALFWLVYIGWTLVFHWTGLRDDAGNRYIYVMVRWDVFPWTEITAFLLVTLAAPLVTVGFVALSGWCKRGRQVVPSEEVWDSV